MARLRYRKAPATPRGALRNTVRSLRAVYETDPAIVAALLPAPLRPGRQPHVFVQFAHVVMHVAPDRDVTIGAATVGVAAEHDGRPGYRIIAMPMEGERVVMAGRERFGEPKKLAEIAFSVEGGQAHASATRHGVTFLELTGTLGEALPCTPFTEHFYCFKAMPAVDPAALFDGDALLVELSWQRNYALLRSMTGQILLRESAHDPLIDVPVRRIVQMQYAEGATRTSGRVLGPVRGEDLLPFSPIRYDDPTNPGVEVS